MSFDIQRGDCLDVLRTMPDESVQCCVTSPPYWGLRDYGVAGQLGLERTPEEYVAKMVEVFREVRRVLRKDGTLWLNLGDSYAGSWGNYGGQNRGNGTQRGITTGSQAPNPAYDGLEQWRPPASGKLNGIKPKDLCGIPWMVAFALRSDGWYLRQDIIWAKPNPMPESVRDRCTKSHEYIFLLSKSERYYYDSAAISEETVTFDENVRDRETTRLNNTPGRKRMEGLCENNYETRNKRSVWNVTTKPYPEAHFATFPPEIPEICIKAGTKEGDTVLDPFNGAGTTGLVATRLMRNYIGIELNPEYVTMSNNRIVDDSPLFNKQIEQG